MVNVKIRGKRKDEENSEENWTKDETYDIGTIKANVQITNNGIRLQLSSKKLSKEIERALNRAGDTDD